MKVDIVKGPAAFKGLEPSWRQLEGRCSATVFQTWDWSDCWLARDPRAQPTIAVVTRGERPRAIAPLSVKRWYGLPVRRATFIGTGPADYGGFLAETPQDLDALAAAFPEFDCDLFDLHQLRETTAGRLADKLAGAFDVLVLPQEATLAVELPADFDSYLGGLSKRFRKNTIYAARRLQRDFRYERRAYGAGDDIGKAMSIFFHLHQRRWLSRRLPGLFLGGGNRAFHQDLAQRMAKRDRLVLSLIWLEGRPAAAFYGFKFNGDCSYYLGGFDPDCSKFSVSTILIFDLLKEATEAGVQLFDFLRGQEPYKSRWGAERRPLYRLIASRRTVRGRLGARLASAENTIVQRTRARLHS
jgi:CelD/BcsL family acetyltransferase involved in cellulose biosynthesis